MTQATSWLPSVSALRAAYLDKVNRPFVKPEPQAQRPQPHTVVQAPSAPRAAAPIAATPRAAAGTAVRLTFKQVRPGPPTMTWQAQFRGLLARATNANGNSPALPSKSAEINPQPRGAADSATPALALRPPLRSPELGRQVQTPGEVRRDFAKEMISRIEGLQKQLRPGVFGLS